MYSHCLAPTAGWLIVPGSTSLEINHKSQEVVKKSQAGGGVAVKIEHAVYQSAKMFGRHFDDKDEVFSHITRQSIDVLKVSGFALQGMGRFLMVYHRQLSKRMCRMRSGYSSKPSSRYVFCSHHYQPVSSHSRRKWAFSSFLFVPLLLSVLRSISSTCMSHLSCTIHLHSSCTLHFYESPI
jgi:hypothetical protein